MEMIELTRKLEEELRNLDEKCEKLLKFLKDDKFTQLDPYMQNCLTTQFMHMVGYASCLVSRIELLKSKQEV